MKATEILRGIVTAMLLATAIFHPLCVIAFALLGIMYHAGRIVRAIKGRWAQ